MALHLPQSDTVVMADTQRRAPLRCLLGLALGLSFVSALPPDSLPVTRLYQAEPNPFSEATIIRYSLGRPLAVNLVVYDAVGRAVQVLATGELPEGHYVTRWDGTDRAGEQLKTGIYFCKLFAGRFRQTQRMVLLRD